MVRPQAGEDLGDKMTMWARQHYNAIASEIRAHFPVEWSEHDRFEIPMSESMQNKANLQRGVLVSLSLDLARRFKDDNEEFDPIKFLDACSPNVDLYPLSELWET